MSILAAFIVPHPPIILPEVGRGEEEKIKKTADSYREIAARVQALAPDTIVLTSPHSLLCADCFHISPGEQAQGDFAWFEATAVTVSAEYDQGFTKELIKLCEEWEIPTGTFEEPNDALDHGTMVPLHFVNERYTDYRLVRIGLSELSPLIHYRFGKCIAQAAEETGRRVVMIASGDLSHKLMDDEPYSFAEEGPKFDALVTEAMEKGDFLRFLTLPPELCAAAGECGLRSFQIMAGTLDGKAVKSELLSYEGPFGVGYSVAAFTPTGNDPKRCFDVICEEQEKSQPG